VYLSKRSQSADSQQNKNVFSSHLRGLLTCCDDSEETAAHRHWGAYRKLLDLSNNNRCARYGDVETVSHIVNECSQTELTGGLHELYLADSSSQLTELSHTA